MNTHTTTPAALAAFGTAALGSSHSGASSSSSGQQAAAPDNPMMPAPMAIAPSEHGIFQGRPPFARSPPPPGSASGSFSFLDGLGAMQAAAEDRSLPPTPRSPSPTCSPPGSPKRQKAAAEREAANRAAAVGGADSAAEDDLETRAAALGLNEVTQRVWRETALPPTPSSPSPTFSPPSSPKQRHAAEQTAKQAAEKLAESLRAEAQARGAAFDLGSASCGSDSEGNAASAEADVTAALAAWGGARHGSNEERGPSSNSRRKKRATPL